MNLILGRPIFSGYVKLQEPIAFRSDMFPARNSGPWRISPCVGHLVAWRNSKKRLFCHGNPTRNMWVQLWVNAVVKSDFFAWDKICKSYFWLVGCWQVVDDPEIPLGFWLFHRSHPEAATPIDDMVYHFACTVDGSEIRRSPVEVGRYPIIYRVSAPFQVVVWDFWSINLISVSLFTYMVLYIPGG